MKYSFFIYLLVMAIVTYLVRMLPLVLIKKKIKNVFVLSFLHYMPYAVLCAMTVPAVFFATDNIYTAVAGFVVALVLAFFKKGLTTVAVGAVIGVLLGQAAMTYIF